MHLRSWKGATQVHLRLQIQGGCFSGVYKRESLRIRKTDLLDLSDVTVEFKDVSMPTESITRAADRLLKLLGGERKTKDSERVSY